MINTIRPIVPAILASFMLLSADPKRDNHFLGRWEIDVQKTLSSNDLPPHVNMRLNISPTDYVINFALAGKYFEIFGNQTVEGTWSRYETDIAVARVETDENIKKRKKRLKQRLSNSKLTRYEITRLQQKEYLLNRASVKSFEYKNGYIILNLTKPDKDIELFFKRGI
tara:strand:+ start:2831 stop:3334 length:504 start_codon:yes stop_codon:yes gene_type:complete